MGMTLTERERTTLEKNPLRPAPDMRAIPDYLLARDGEVILDLRGVLIGCDEAAQIVGLKRTQMWRYAKTGKIPCVRLGTEERPIYRFRLEDVYAFRKQRDRDRAINRFKRWNKLLKDGSLSLKRLKDGRVLVRKEPISRLG